MAMAGQRRTVAALVVALLAMVVVCVHRAEAASYESVSMMDFGTSGLESEMEDLHMSIYDSEEDQFLDEPSRRLLAARRSYVSYGALNGNRSPCPARSGRSYYTPNCQSRSGPVQPYRRGCYQITRCARG